MNPKEWWECFSHNRVLVQSGELQKDLIVEEVGPGMLPTAAPGDDGAGWKRQADGTFLRARNPADNDRVPGVAWQASTRPVETETIKTIRIHGLLNSKE